MTGCTRDGRIWLMASHAAFSQQAERRPGSPGDAPLAGPCGRAVGGCRGRTAARMPAARIPGELASRQPARRHPRIFLLCRRGLEERSGDGVITVPC